MVSDLMTMVLINLTWKLTSLVSKAHLGKVGNSHDRIIENDATEKCITTKDLAWRSKVDNL